jgi:hypothetical protein
MVTLNALILVIGILAAMAAGYAIAKLHSWASAMQRRLEALEQAQAKHLPYRTADEIEAATAAILKIKFETDFRQEVIENALAHLQIARNGNKEKRT